MVKFLAPVIFAAVVIVICADLQKDFTDLGCKGTYDESKMSAVVGVCSDCFELFREDSLRNLCRSKCFTTDYFGGCLESTGASDSKEHFKKIVKDLSGLQTQFQK